MVDVCEIIAKSWEIEAKKFDGQCSDVGTKKSVVVSSIKSNEAQDNLATWKKTKQEMQSYIEAMTAINSRFNFETEAKPSFLKAIKFHKLDLSISVPNKVYRQFTNSDEDDDNNIQLVPAKVTTHTKKELSKPIQTEDGTNIQLGSSLIYIVITIVVGLIAVAIGVIILFISFDLKLNTV